MSRIERVSVRRMTLANTTLLTSYGSNVNQREHLFVGVHDEDGALGIGEGSPLPHFSGERAADMERIVREALGPAVIGSDPFDLEQITTSLDRALPHHGASKAAIVNAVLDLQGKIVGLPVHRLLGGAVLEHLPLAGAVGIEAPETVIAKVEDLVARSIRTIKVKVGTDPARDLRTLEALRERFGFEIELRADANAGFGRADARRFLDAARNLRLQYVEQPLPAADLEGLAELRRLQATPIAVDESLFGLHDAMAIIRSGAADILIIKLIKLGGLYGARKVAAVAEAAGLGCVAVSPYETMVGVSANVHLAAVSAAFGYDAELGVGVSAVSLAEASGLEYGEGFVKVPMRPGLGVSLREGFFEEGVNV